MKSLFLASFFILACVVSANTLAGAHLKIAGIEGNSTDKKHQGWIDLDSYQWGMASPSSASSGQSRRRGSATIEDLTFTHQLDTSSLRLAEALATGRVIPMVELHLHQGPSEGRGDSPYLLYRLTNVMVTAYHIDWQSDDRPTEKISMRFEKLKMEYSPVKGERVDWSWDAEGNR